MKFKHTSIPLKVKIFMWYFRRRVVLTKHNLTLRNREGCKRCSFCSHGGTIKHLSFPVQVCAIQLASNLYPPISVANIYGHWMDGVPNSFRTLISMGASVLLWSLWLCRNDLVLNDKNSSPLQVIFCCTHSLRTWSTLQ